MRGRRLEKTGGVFAGIRRGFFRAENDADACRSFAAVEWHDSDRSWIDVGKPSAQNPISQKMQKSGICKLAVLKAREESVRFCTRLPVRDLQEMGDRTLSCRWTEGSRHQPVGWSSIGRFCQDRPWRETIAQHSREGVQV
jgi:hypothetical protein